MDDLPTIRIWVRRLTIWLVIVLMGLLVLCGLLEARGYSIISNPGFIWLIVYGHFVAGLICLVMHLTGLVCLWVYSIRLEHQREERRWAAFLKALKMLKEVEDYPTGR